MTGDTKLHIPVIHAIKNLSQICAKWFIYIFIIVILYFINKKSTQNKKCINNIIENKSIDWKTCIWLENWNPTRLRMSASSSIYIWALGAADVESGALDARCLVRINTRCSVRLSQVVAATTSNALIDCTRFTENDPLSAITTVSTYFEYLSIDLPARMHWKVAQNRKITCMLSFANTSLLFISFIFVRPNPIIPSNVVMVVKNQNC